MSLRRAATAVAQRAAAWAPSAEASLLNGESAEALLR
jgi:hypothetical protein